MTYYSPTASTSSSGLAFASPANAYDGDTSTYASRTVSTSVTNGSRWYGFTSVSLDSTITVEVWHRGTVNSVWSSVADGYIQSVVVGTYSWDGTTWEYLFTFTPDFDGEPFSWDTAGYVSTAIDSTGQDLSTLQIKVECTGTRTSDAIASAVSYLHEIRAGVSGSSTSTFPAKKILRLR